MIVNSVCGCAAGRARPAIGLALEHGAGGDEAAVAYLRARLSDYPASSPSMALFHDGKPVCVRHRSEIERREAPEIADRLTGVFDQFCSTSKPD